MTIKERASCINTIKLLQRLAFNVHGVMDVIDAENCDKIIKMLEDESQQWIPGKPKESGMYLVTGKEHFVPDHVDEPSTRDGAVGIAAYSEKWGWLDHKIHPVKAYMPLPKPYVPRRRRKK